MKSLLLSTALLLATQGFSQTGETTVYNLTSGGIDRSYRVYLPKLYDGQTPRPVVFNFHGWSATAGNHEGYTRFREVADTANIILVTPQGTILKWGTLTNYGWNDYTNVINGPDDVLFTSDMIDSLVKNFNVDTTRIYATGWSNGGDHSYLLSRLLAHRIAAIGSVSGSMQDSMFIKLPAKRPMPVMEIHGTADNLAPYNGGPAFGLNWESVQSILDFWINFNNCNITPTITNLPNTNTNDGSTVQRHNWSGGTDCTEVELLKIIGGGHWWPDWKLTQYVTNRDITADVELWRFFRRHSLKKISAAKDLPEQALLSISPNPATDQLTIQFSEKIEATELTITDLSGRFVLQQKLNKKDLAKSVSVPIQHLAQGSYVLSASAAGRLVGVGRFVVLR